LNLRPLAKCHSWLWGEGASGLKPKE
jgi:hypothetical protein